MNQQPRVPLSPLENLAVGALGGALETCLQMPIITYKFCVQEGRALPRNASGWYRGVFVQASTVAPITAIQFMVNEDIFFFIILCFVLSLCILIMFIIWDLQAFFF
jgi:hypothetical protein